ncbi:MAG: alpha/beta fold hydrolase, partial [Chloroflexi bacterium]|nr:alpha/beta fold hydrolase [Chloroflexota bacterium]
MATYVLVHWAWHGGWCWQLVAPIMRVAKHDVYTPTLTGMGERSHLRACGVDLNTHIRDVTNLLFYEDLTNIVLVGHGAASLVVNGVAAEMAERIGQIVYFDAYMPVDSQFPFDIWPMEQQTGTPDQVTTLQAVRLPPAATTLGISERRMVEWVEELLVPQPLSTYQLAGQNNISHHAAMFATGNANTPRA